MQKNQKDMTALEIEALINRFQKLTSNNRWSTIELISRFCKLMDAEEGERNKDEITVKISDLQKIAAAMHTTVEELFFNPVNREQADKALLTVSETNSFLDGFEESPTSIRDMILVEIFRRDQKDRRKVYSSSELLNASFQDLLNSMTDAQLEQLHRYAVMLFESHYSERT